MKLYQRIAGLIVAIQNCEKSGNTEWKDRHTDILEKLVREHLPHGSGFDSGTQLSMDESWNNQLRFTTAFHHMDEHGGYDGWTEHVVTAKPDLCFGFVLTVSGKTRNDIKDYIVDVFSTALHGEVSE